MKIRELAQCLREGTVTSVQLAEHSLQRIAADDRNGHGLTAVAELNPDVMFLARALDQELKEKGPRSLLHGIPVLVKDNIAVKDVMHNTAGSEALADLIPNEDAFVIQKLKDAGALILGKANLSEFAHWKASEEPSGFSSRGGQVVSPYKKGFDPSGSSSGSGVAAAARYTPYTIGTETDGSLTSPGRANAVTVIKPTVGRVSRTGIIPISSIQDTAGPMATCVEDCAAVLEVIQGKDPLDAATYNETDETYLDACVDDIRGWRIGLVTTTKYKMRPQQQEAYELAKRTLEACGAEVVEVTLDDSDSGEGALLYHEFKNAMERYLASVKGLTKMEHLSDIVAYNNAHPETCLVYGQDLLEDSDKCSGLLNEPEYISERMRIDARTHELIDGTIKEKNLKCLAMVQVSHIAPVSGNPVIAIPCAEINEEDPQPVSIQVIGLPYDEKTIIRAAYALEQKLNLHCRPSWVKEYFE